ncbi:MAG: hypothetical protein AB7Q81_12070 [Gammaproteobacteria bacterium]
MGRREFVLAEQRLPELRQLTILMLAAVDAGQWGVVARLRAERARLLDTLTAALETGVATAA